MQPAGILDASAKDSGGLIEAMCNLYSITTNQDAIRRLFGAVFDSAGNLPSMPAVFPDQEAPVVRNYEGGRELIKMRWGMPPPPKFGGPPVTNPPR
jgi:putative SOS response-associated peptidase YedK